MTYPSTRALVSALLTSTVMAVAAIGMSYAAELEQQTLEAAASFVPAVPLPTPALVDVGAPVLPVASAEASTETQILGASEEGTIDVTADPGVYLRESIERFTEMVEQEAAEDEEDDRDDEDMETSIIHEDSTPMPVDVTRILDDAVRIDASNGSVHVSAPSDAEVHVGTDAEGEDTVLHIESDDGTTHIEMSDESSVRIHSETSGDGDAENSIRVRVSN